MYLAVTGKDDIAKPVAFRVAAKIGTFQAELVAQLAGYGTISNDGLFGDTRGCLLYTSDAADE